MTYAEKLLDPRWQKKRLIILERDKWACGLCHDPETTLHVHHLSYTGNDPWDSPDDQLITVCKHCHAVIEFNKGSLQEKYFRILKRELISGAVLLTLIYLDEGEEVLIDIYHYTKNNELEYKTSINEEHLIDIKENIEFYYHKAEAP